MESPVENGNQTPQEAEQLLGAIDAAIASIGKHLREEGGVKGSLTDLVRLLQLRKELGAEDPRNITVRWIGSCETWNG